MKTPTKPSNRAQKRKAAKTKKRSKKSFAQITTVTKQYSLQWLWENLIKNDNVRADLSFQSRVRWPESNRKSYMTSLLLRMAPSKFIFASTEGCGVAATSEKDVDYYNNWKEIFVQYLNIDSNNRVTTIKAFMNNEFGLEPGIYNLQGSTIEIVEGVNDTYENLPNVVRQSLMISPITIEVITNATRVQLSDQFRRMNDGVYLNGPEKRNAVISDFSTVIRDLATEYEKVLSCYLTPAEIGRRKVDDFIAGLALVSLHGSGVKITEKSLNEAYEDTSQESNTVWGFAKDFERFMKVFTPYINYAPNKNSVLDLHRIWKEYGNDGRLLNDAEGFFKRFGLVHTTLLKDTTLYEVSNGKSVTYKELCRSREGKYNLLRRSLLEGGSGDCRPNVTLRFNADQFFGKVRDSRRTFSKEEKLTAAYDQDWTTPEGKTIEIEDIYDPSEFQGGHIIPHAAGVEAGGTTTQENCVVQTTEDNQALGNNPVVVDK